MATAVRNGLESMLSGSRWLVVAGEDFASVVATSAMAHFFVGSIGFLIIRCK